MNLPIDLIDADPNQPRTVFDDAEIESLASSMAATGQAVAILVRPVEDRFVIVHGERRYRAALRLGWRELRAEVSDVAAEDVPWLALVENVQRQDLTPIEEAKAYQRMVEAGFTQGEVGRRVGKTQSYVAQKLRLLKLPATVQDLLSSRTIAEGHARQLLRLDAEASIQRIADEAVTKSWSVKRLKLEVDFQQMVDDGYWLRPIDDKWKFQDLVELEKAPFDDDGEARLRVQRCLGQILNFTKELWEYPTGAALVKYLLGDASLLFVYMNLTWYGFWKRLGLNGHCDLDAWLYFRFLVEFSDDVYNRAKASDWGNTEAIVALVNDVAVNFGEHWEKIDVT